MKEINKSAQALKGKRKVYFRLLSIVFSFVLLVFIELILRLFSVGDNLNLFINHPDQEYAEYKMVNPIVGKKYFQKLEYTRPANDIFLKKKPEGCIRIFAMGSSTVYGFPYGHNLMYTRILHQMLEDSYPNKKIEVVNTAITAINTYTFADYIDEILDYEPDAILFYEGHNEFYGAFGIGSNETMSRNKSIIRLHLKLMDLRIYQVLRKAINGITAKIGADKTAQNRGTLMKRIVSNKEILYNSDDYKTALNYFSDNLTTIIEKANKKQVPIFISELVSNVKDLPPFNSIASDNLEAAIDVYNKAQKALADSNYALAEELFVKAKDLDCIRFRASEDINDIIRELAKKYDVPLVPMLKYFKEKSEFGIIGNKLLTEHVHPNSMGYFIMANAYYQSLVNSQVFSGKPEPYNIKPLESYIRNYGYTELDVLAGFHKVQLLKHYWPFVKDFNNTKDYKIYYKPKSIIDSLAFQTVKYENVELGTTHLDLAKKFEAQNDFFNAFREYETVLRMNPYIAVNYRDAANCLLQLSDLPLALKYYEKSLQYENSFFALFKAGEIFLIKGDYKLAADRLEKAYKISPDANRNNVLQKLYLSLVYGGNTAKAGEIGKELQAVTGGEIPNIPTKYNYFLEYIPAMTAPEVSLAKSLMSDGNLDKALEVLFISLEKWDSHIANRLIGEILIQKKDYRNAAFYFGKTYSQFNCDARFLKNYILLLLTQNDKIKARECLERLKNVEPGFPEIRYLEEMIQSQK